MSLAFLPLYFEDEDSDIWMRIKRVDPERRCQYIKELLRQALFDGTTLTQEYDPGFNQTETELMPAVREVRTESGEDVSSELLPDSASGEIPEDVFSLEDLFVVTQSPQKQKDEESTASYPVSGAEQPDSGTALEGMKGLNHLLMQVIGEEKDQEVLSFFARRNNKGDR